MRVDVGTDDETDNVEEGYPSRLGQELLGKGQRDGRDDPADLHDGPEAGLDGRLDLVESTGARDKGHGDEVDAVLDGRNLRLSATGRGSTALHVGTYDQVAGKDLQNLGLEALAPLENLLQSANQDVAKGRADEGAVDGHLGDARGEVVARLAPVVGNPRGQKLLQAREGARRQHLGAQRVALQLLEVCLVRARSVCALPSRRQSPTTHCEVSIGTAAFGDGLPNLVHQVALSLAGRVGNGGRCVNRLLLELDRHGASIVCDGSRLQMGACTRKMRRPEEGRGEIWCCQAGSRMAGDEGKQPRGASVLAPTQDAGFSGGVVI